MAGPPPPRVNGAQDNRALRSNAYAYTDSVTTYTLPLLSIDGAGPKSEFALIVADATVAPDDGSNAYNVDA